MADNLFVGLGEALHKHYNYDYGVGMNRDATALTSPSEPSVPKDLVVPKSKLCNAFDETTFVTLDPSIEMNTAYSSTLTSSFRFVPALANEFVGVGKTFCSFVVEPDDQKPALWHVFSCGDVFSCSVKNALEVMEKGTAEAFGLIRPQRAIGNVTRRKSIQFPPKIGVDPKSAFNRTECLRREINEQLALKQGNTVPSSPDGYSQLQKLPSRFGFRNQASGIDQHTEVIPEKTAPKNSIQSLNAFARAQKFAYKTLKEKLQAAYESEKNTSKSVDKRSVTTKSIPVDQNSGKNTSTPIDKSSGKTKSRPSKESKGWRQLFTSARTSKENNTMKHKNQNENGNGKEMGSGNDRNSSNSNRQESMPLMRKRKNETGSTRTGTQSQTLTNSEKGAESIKPKHSKEKLKSRIHESTEKSNKAKNSWGIKSLQSRKRREVAKETPMTTPRRKPPKVPESLCTSATSRGIPPTKRGLKGSGDLKRQPNVAQRRQHQDLSVPEYFSKTSVGKRNQTMGFKRTIHPGKNQPPKIIHRKRERVRTPEPSRKALHMSDHQVNKTHAYGSMHKPLGTKNRHSSNKLMETSDNRSFQKMMHRRVPTSPVRPRAQEISINETTSNVFGQRDDQAASKSVTWKDRDSQHLPAWNIPPFVAVEDEHNMTENNYHGYRNRNPYATVDSCGTIHSNRIGRPNGFTSSNEVKNLKCNNFESRKEPDKESSAYSSIRRIVLQEKHRRRHDAVRKAKYTRSDDSTESESSVSNDSYMDIASPYSDFIQSRKSFSYFLPAKSEF